MKRTLNLDVSLGEKVKVSGWVQTVRSHGKIIFIDLRDISGILQIVFDKKDCPEIEKVRPEWVISVEGKINERPSNMINSNLGTGKLEMKAESLEIFSEAKTLPFGENASEDVRMKYRYLDLRSERMKNNLISRHKVIQFIREFLIKEGFIEIETPILTKSTPEGARDFLIPSRVYPGKFYALPQSPQQYKQLLMVAGFEKYFQIARCFRDEDSRTDRQPEFTQLDLEMAFTSQKEILELTENLYFNIVKKIFPDKKILEFPFPRIKYEDAIKKYKTDKPDLRKNPDELAFAFILDFPMFEWKKSEKRWDAVHHPFTRPQTEDIKEMKKNPGKVLAHQYDFVLNGSEIGGGSLRSYKTEILKAVFEIMGHKEKEIKEQFGHLFEAFSYGVPPHGGIAPGIDRFLSIILNQENIREVIAFPKTGDSRGLMMEIPSEVSEKQLKELHIKTIKK